MDSHNFHHRGSYSTRSWVQGNGIKVYVRITQRLVADAIAHTIDVANIEVEQGKRGAGVFTRWRGYVEQRDGDSVSPSYYLEPPPV
jgi:hypothetical protein